MSVELVSTGVKFPGGGIQAAPAGGAIVKLVTSPGSGSFTIPASGVYYITACGGGGSGGGGNGNGYTSGGSGAYIHFGKYTGTPGDSVSYTVGAGKSSHCCDQNGQAGNATTVGSLTLGGGGGGKMYSWGSQGAAGTVSGAPSTYLAKGGLPGLERGGYIQLEDYMSIMPLNAGRGGSGVINGGWSHGGGDGFLLVVSGD